MKLRAYWILLFIGALPMILLMPLWAIVFVLTGNFVPAQYLEHHVKIGNKIGL
jgi:hypothetical protein